MYFTFIQHMSWVCTNSLLNTHENFLETYTEAQALEAIKSIVTQRINPDLHRLEFHKIQQRNNESIKELEVRLRSAAKDCAYSCLGCNYDLSNMEIRGQFIQALQNKTLQTDVLTLYVLACSPRIFICGRHVHKSLWWHHQRRST